MRFSGKTAVVTGAAGGMGARIASGLLAEGASVAMLDHQPGTPGDARAGACSVFFQGDLRDLDFVQRSFAEFFAQTGALDYLVNAAGVLWFDRDRSAIDIDLDTWSEVFDINLKTMVHTTRVAIPLMRSNGGGAIVHVSTTQCLRGDNQPQDAYQASKAGVIALSKSLAIQFAADNIRSNVLIPGPTDTPMQARWRDNPDQGAAAAAAIPLGRLGTASDMANATLFLLSDQASFITGTELIVDGGLLARP